MLILSSGGIKLRLLLSIAVLSCVTLYFATWLSNDAPKDKLDSFRYTSTFLKMIDQYGEPIVDVEAFIVHGTNGFISSMGAGTYVSDNAGLTEIKVDNRSFSLNEISKEGYIFNIRKVINNAREKLSDVNPQSDISSRDFEKFTKDSPFEIGGWRISEGARLSKCVNGGLRMQLKNDGRTYGVDFLKSRSQGRVTEDAPDRSIQFSFYREFLNKPQNRLSARENIERMKELFELDWKFSINLVGAGILEIVPGDNYSVSPPTSGYLSQWELSKVNFREHKYKYQTQRFDDERHFYLQFDDGTYGRIGIIFDPSQESRDYDPYGVIKLNFSINTSGSRLVKEMNSFGSSIADDGKCY